MSKNNIKLAVAIILLGVAGFIVYTATKAPPKKVHDQPMAVLQQAKQASDTPSTPSTSSSRTPSAGGISETDTAAAKDQVKRFVLGVANPSKPTPTAEDTQTALSTLNKDLQKKVAQEGGQPGKLLGITHPKSFETHQPRGVSGNEQVVVTFMFAAAPPTDVTFSLERSGTTWLIKDIQKK